MQTLSAKAVKTLKTSLRKKEPSLKKPTLEYYVNTFKTLSEFADFGAPLLEREGKEEEKEEAKGVGKGRAVSQEPEGIIINLNVQITLPITNDAKVYESIFKAIKEQLYTRS